MACTWRNFNKISTKGHSFLVWYSIDREDQESESGFLCKKHFFVEKTVLIQSALGNTFLTKTEVEKKS